MKGRREKGEAPLVIVIFFSLLISTAQGTWDIQTVTEEVGQYTSISLGSTGNPSISYSDWTNDDLKYIKMTTELRQSVHNINTGEDFENIQAAIDDPDTQDGHTIFVDAGIYDKRVVINKQVKLIGENKDTTKIDGEGSENCIQVTADNVEICNFTIRNGFYGVYLESSNCRVINNYILSVTFDGISLRNSVNNTIAHNCLSLVKGDGIHLSSSTNNWIYHNDLSENGGGISLSGSHNNTISYNSLTDNSNRGIRLSSSNMNLIRDNNLSGSEEGIFLHGCNKNLIYHNNIINNINQAKDITGTNLWDYGPKDGGNYWSDHECTGNPSDGNQPYNISGGMGAKDNYPFMDKDGWLLTCTPPSSPTLTDPGTTDTDGNYTVSWSSVSSATTYTLQEDKTISFSNPTEVYSGPETSKEITGKSEGTYYYRVNASNACGCSEWSNKENITIKIDTKPPVISHEPITNATGGVSIPICATIRDDTKVANATLHYRITGEEAWIIISMTHIGDNYSATIPASHVTIKGVEYYIKAVDDAANSASSPAEAPEKPYSITVSNRSIVTISVTNTISEGVTISGNIIPAHSAIVTLTFTPPASAETVIEESTTSTTSGTYKFDFTPYKGGIWRVNATWTGDSDTMGNSSETVSFTVNRGQVYYALIIAGEKCDPTESYFGLTANKVYNKLLTCGFTHKRIFYLNPSMEQDADGDGIYDVDRITSLTNISYAINTWAQGNVRANDSLLLYIVAKGEENAFCVNGIANTKLTATELKNYLDNFTKNRSCDDVVVVYDALYSGSFIDELSCTGRIIVTSTNIITNNTELFDKIKGGFFSYYFFNSISAGKTIKEAFEDASNSFEITNGNITPLLDDNGDRFGHAIKQSGFGKGVLEPSSRDGSFAEYKYIGIRYGASPPTITNLIPSQYVELNTDNTNITIWAVVVSDSLIEEVQALINKLNSSFNTTLYLKDPDGDANYTAIFNITDTGNYSVILSAIDEEGNMGSSKQCTFWVVPAESAIFDMGKETYTYTWKGTGGHSEYEKIWNSTWKGIEVYFLGGEITHREFVDTKGQLNINWIPAIKLEEM